MRNYSPSRGGPQKWTRNNEGFRTRSPRSKDEDLALFHDMRTRENKNFLHPSTDDIEASLPTKLGGLTGFRITASPTPSWKGTDLLATPDSDKTDYDWLLTPPGTPLFPSLDKDSLQTYMDRNVVAPSSSASRDSRLSGSNTPELHRMLRRSPGPQTPPSTLSSTNSSHMHSRPRAPSPSRVSCSPTLRPSTPVKSLARSTTFMNRASTRSSPPVLRRTNTSPSIRSSSTERNATPSSRGRRSMSPKMQAWQAPELGFSAEPPPNLRTSLSDRPLSSSRNVTPRPRIGFQEARHHQEARHSYSEAMDSRQSHWRNSSSSASKLSSSTTSQDRWSSRGSVVSSSDDGMDVLEPTFLDFSLTSPSSTSGMSKPVSRRFDDEVRSSFSHVVSRQKKASTPNAETAAYSTATARKSLEPSMQRVDHRHVSSTMFRPLMSSAPTTSYCNSGHPMIRHRPASPFVEPSITASSNASSERGVRIFPGNGSSDEEVESEWDKSIPAGSTMRKLASQDDDAIDEDYHRVQGHVDQYEQESVADNASCTMDGCEPDRAMYVSTLEWERNQTSGKAESQDKDQKSCMSKSSIKGHEQSSIKGLVHDSTDQDALLDQEAGANRLIVNNQEHVQISSARSYCDSIPPHTHFGQEEVEIHDMELTCNKPYKADDDNFQAATRVVEAGWSPKRCRNAQDFHSTEESQQIRLYPPVVESIANGCIHETISCCDDDLSASLHCPQVVESPHSVQVTPFMKNTDVSGSEHGIIAALQNDSLPDMKESPVMHVLVLNKAHTVDNAPTSCESVVAGIPVPGHVEREDHFQPKSPTITNGPQLCCCQELGEELSSFPSNPRRAEVQSDLLCQPELPSQGRGQEHCIDTPELEEGKRSKGLECNAVMIPENELLTRAVDSERFSSSVDQAEDCQFGSLGHQAIDSDSEDINQLNRTLPQNEFVQGSPLIRDEENLEGDEEKNNDCNGLADGLLLMLDIPHTQLQSTEHPSVDSGMDPEESTLEICLVTEVSEERELPNSGDHSASDSFQSILQPPDSSSDVTRMQPGLQEEAVSANVIKAKDPEDTTLINFLNTTEGQHQPQRGSPLESEASPGHRAAIPSFSLEEARHTILFCSSIVHDIVYQAASIASEKEAEAMKAATPLVSQSRGQNANAAFMSSLREKVSKSATWKVRHKEAKPPTTKPQKQEVSEVPTPITKHPTPILGMDREPVKFEADKAFQDNNKEKSFMGLSVNSNCQCAIM